MESFADSLMCKYPDCGKMLSSKYNLKRHVESCHLGSRPYECNICYKCFSSKQNKREHVRLEHSYGFIQDETIRRPSGTESHIINIPKLCALLRKSEDPDIRPLAKVEKIYLYADLSEKIELPRISSERQNPCELPQYRD